MKYFSMLIKPASGLCNLKCKYCFYEDVMENRDSHDYGVMSTSTMQELIKNVLFYFEDDVEINFSFQGGEPTLIGIDFFRDFVEYVNFQKKDYHHIRYSIQTNGTLLNEDWYVFLKQNNFLVGLSLDGFQNNHDKNRYDIKKRGTFKRVLNSAKELRKRKIEFNILTVLTNELAKYPKQLWDFYREHDFRYIQLIPCLPPFEGSNGMELTPRVFYTFYNQFFKYWYQAWKVKDYISITLFDNLIPMLVGIPPQQCGYLGFCTLQFVVEANGDAYPCDFYVLDQYKIGNVAQQDFKTIIQSGIKNPFLYEKKESCNLCKNCKYRQICNGQCKRLSVCYYDKTYCGYQQFINENIDKLIEVSHEMESIKR